MCHHAREEEKIRMKEKKWILDPAIMAVAEAAKSSCSDLALVVHLSSMQPLF